MDQTRHRAVHVPSALERLAIAPHRGDVTTVQAALRVRARAAAASEPVLFSARDPSPDRSLPARERAEDRVGPVGLAPSGAAGRAAGARPPADGAAVPSGVGVTSPAPSIEAGPDPRPPAPRAGI